MEEFKYDFTLLKERIRKMYGEFQKLAEDIDMSLISLSRKLNNHSYFRSNEITLIANKLGITPNEIPEYFYNLKE